MTSSPGIVCVNADGARAVFIPADDLTTLREMAGEILDDPRCAGPVPPLTALDELRNAVERATATPTTPLSLSEPVGKWLELLHDQADIKVALHEEGRLRIRLRCTACGKERLINPTREAQRAAQRAKKRKARRLSSTVESVTGFDLSHPYLSMARIFLNRVGSQQPSDDDEEETWVCERCDGVDFEIAPVVFCPGCRELRDENVLVTCPACRFSFLGTVREQTPWTDLRTARRNLNAALLAAHKSAFENGLWAGQFQALVDSLSGDEQPIAMCRCARPGELGRYVALLFTTAGLTWARESAFSATTSGTVPWPDVTGIEDPDTTNNRVTFESGLKLVLKAGDPVVFNDFRGSGVRLADRECTFDAAGVRELARGLWEENRRPRTMPR